MPTTIGKHVITSTHVSELLSFQIGFEITNKMEHKKEYRITKLQTCDEEGFEMAMMGKDER